VVREELIVVEGGRTGPVSLATTAGLEVHGTVVDERGMPVARASVFASQPGGGFRPTRTDEDGTFVLRNLSPGKVQLTVSGRGMWGGGPRASTQVEAGTSGVRLVLTEGLSLGGRVVDQVSRSPVHGARVSLRQKRENGSSRTRMTIVTNGVFRFTNLEPGEYTLTFSGGGYQEQAEGPHTLVEGRSLDDLLVQLRKE
jgi:protocatechuate 3,4-dioxygenase beta subunit